MKFASVLAAVAAVSIASSQSNPLAEMVFTDTKAIGILPPTVVASGDNIQANWSPDGKYLLVCSVDSKLSPALIQQVVAKGGAATPPVMPDNLLTLYSLDKQSGTLIWKGRMDAGRIGQVQWLEGRGQWAVTFDVPVKTDQGPTEFRQVVQILNPSSGKLVQFYQAAIDEYVNIETDEKSGNAVLISRKSPPGGDGIATTSMSAITRDGKLGTFISLPDGIMFGGIIWDSVTHRPSLRAWQRAGAAKPVQAWFEIDFASSALRPGKVPSIQPEPELPSEFDLQDGPTTSRSMEATVNLKGAWIVAKLKGPHQNGLVAAEVDQMSLSPAKNAVFYSTKGVGMVRQLAPIPKELALKALEAAERTKILNEAKQAALAFIMFAADSDDVMPNPSSDWAGNLQPYLKNGSILEGFVYSFGGGNLNDVADPARTEMGYKIGPGGRAVAYVDGHVKWIPDKP